MSPACTRLTNRLSVVRFQFKRVNKASAFLSHARPFDEVMYPQPVPQGPHLAFDPLAVKQEPVEAIAPAVHNHHGPPHTSHHSVFKSGPYLGLEHHNPFEMNSYPMTNPPIIDSTMYLPYTNESGVPRRRRISISNGQIGQIVNHEAFFMDEELYDELNELSPFPQPAPHLSADPGILYFQEMGDALPAGPFVQLQAPHLVAVTASLLRLSSLAPAPLPVTDMDLLPKGNLHIVAGVPPPNHLLIYNNEVIYNPNNGPIPGTAAWKKERLLERNRVAASKCRQRKKQAQQQLQDNMNKYQSEIKQLHDRLKKYEQLMETYNAVLSRHFATGDSVEELRKFVGKLIDDISLGNN